MVIVFFHDKSHFLFFSDAKHSCHLFAINAYDKKLNYWSSFSYFPSINFPQRICAEEQTFKWDTDIYFYTQPSYIIHCNAFLMKQRKVKYILISGARQPNDLKNHKFANAPGKKEQLYLLLTFELL